MVASVATRNRLRLSQIGPTLFRYEFLRDFDLMPSGGKCVRDLLHMHVAQEDERLLVVPRRFLDALHEVAFANLVFLNAVFDPATHVVPIRRAGSITECIEDARCNPLLCGHADVVPRDSVSFCEFLGYRWLGGRRLFKDDADSS